MNYGCEDASDVLAAFALDALPELDRIALVEHLAECREHDEELAGYRMVASRLPLVVESPAVPDKLKSSLLDAFDRELSGTAVAPTPLPVAVEAVAPEPEPLPVPTSIAARKSGGVLALFRQPSLAYGIAASLLIAVLALAAWNFNLRDDGGDVMTTAAAGPGMSLEVNYYPDRQVVVFEMDMPPTAPGQVYQAWMIADGKPVSLGVMAGNQGRVAFAADMHDADAVAISLEPAGGSPAPTNPIVQANF